MGSVRILTVDDHAAFRSAARALVAATDGFELVGEATTGEEGVAATRKLRPDIVLMDVLLPDIDGYEATRRIVLDCPSTIVALISASDDAIEGEIPARCGAVAFVAKRELRPARLREIWATHGPRPSRTA